MKGLAAATQAMAVAHSANGRNGKTDNNKTDTRNNKRRCCCM
jgi:hypothetical protein